MREPYWKSGHKSHAKMETNGNISGGKSHINTYHSKELVKKTLRAVLGNLDKKK